MSELDKLFKDKLDNRSFELKNEYWAAAEAMIEEDERSRRRGAWWRWYGLLALLLLVTVAGGVYMYNKNQDSTSNDQSKETIIKSKESSSPTITPNTNQQNIFPLQNNTEKGAPDIKSPSEINTDQKNDFTPKAPRAELQTGKQPLNQQKTELPNSNSSSNSGFVTDVESENTITDHNDVALIENKIEKAAPNKDLSTTAVDTDSYDLALLELIDPLENNLQPLEMEEADCETCMTLQRITKPAPSPWHYGAQVEGVTSILDNQIYQFNGGALGGFVSYDINKKLTVESGLQYTRLGFSLNVDTIDGDFLEVLDLDDVIRQSTSNVYSFGERTISVSYRPRTIHLIEVPIDVKLRIKRHNIGVGVQLNSVVGVVGDQRESASLFPWEPDILGTNFSSLQQESNNRSLAGNTFKAFNTGIRLSYEYKFNKRWAVQMSGVYYLQGLHFTQNPDDFIRIDNSSPTAETAISDQNNDFNFGKPQLRVGLRWYLK